MGTGRRARLLGGAAVLLMVLAVPCTSASAKTAQQVIFMSSPPAQVGVSAGEPGYEVSAASSSGLPVRLSAEGACSLTPKAPAAKTQPIAEEASVDFQAIGTCTILATQEGNGEYEHASATQSLPVGPSAPPVSRATVERGAEEEVERLLADAVPLPEGAAAWTQADRQSPQCSRTEGFPWPRAAPILVQDRFWRVPGEPQAVMAWIAAHAPAGALLIGTGTNHVPPCEWSATFGFAPQQPGIALDQLDIYARPAEGGGTQIHAETFVAPNNAGVPKEEPGAARKESPLIKTLAEPGQCGIPASARAELLEDARSAATGSGDPHPYDIQAVRTTSAKATSLRGVSKPNTPANTPVYFLAMRGEFHYSGPRPAPGPGETVREAPPLTVMTVEISASGTGTAWTDSYPDLAALGTPINLEAAQEANCTPEKEQTATATPDPLKLLGRPAVKRRSGTVELKPSVSGPGILTWRLTYKTKTGAIKFFGKGTLKLTGTSKSTITVKPTATALTALKHASRKGHALSLNALFRFRPTPAGTPSSLERTIRVRLS